MRALVRVDSSVRIGTGHLMRCLALAHELRHSGFKIVFACRSLPGNMAALVTRSGHELSMLDADDPRDQAEGLLQDWETDAAQTAAILGAGGQCDWLIVDHYGLDVRWESKLRPFTNNLMVIDDLANRRHDCDVLLDQNLHRDIATRYDNLIPSHCQRLLGPHYALLRREFREARAKLRPKEGSVRRLLIFFGGIDASNETSKALEAFKMLNRSDIAVDIIVGAGGPNLENIRSRCAGLAHARVHHNPSNIAELIANADLAIGAAGATAWERCCLGLPSIVTSLAANQESIAHSLADNNLAIRLGPSGSVTVRMITVAVQALINDFERMQAMRHACTQIADGNGAARVARALEPVPINLRTAEISDCDSLYQWRNAKETRRYSHDSDPIQPQQHLQWFRELLQDPRRVLLIGERNGQPVGVLRYDCDGSCCTVSVYLVPGQHGRGYGPRLLRAGHEWLQRYRPSSTLVRAEVLDNNLASIEAFMQAGYRRQAGLYVKHLG